MSMLKIKMGDTVKIIAGKDKDKEGKVISINRKTKRIIVEGANMVSKHVKPKKMGEAGGIIQAEGAMYACKVQVVCPSCGKATRIAYKISEDGKKQRICKKCGKTL